MKVFVFSQNEVLQRLWSRSSKLPCDLQRQVPAAQEARVEGASDSVPRLMAGHSSSGAETGAYSTNCAAVLGSGCRARFRAATGVCRDGAESCGGSAVAGHRRGGRPVLGQGC